MKIQFNSIQYNAYRLQLHTSGCAAHKTTAVGVGIFVNNNLDDLFIVSDDG